MEEIQRQGEKGQLNPDWVCWLQGWPIGWDSLEPITDLLWLDWSVDPADLKAPEEWNTSSHGGSHSGGYITEWGGSGNKHRGDEINPGTGPIPRIATGIKDRVNRLKALGNGQVPLCAATAWKILTEGMNG